MVDHVDPYLVAFEADLEENLVALEGGSNLDASVREVALELAFL